MRDEDYAKLLEDLERELLAGAGPAGVLGLTPVTLRLLASLAPSGLDAAVEGVYAPVMLDDARPPLAVPVRPFQALSQAQHRVLVVAADAEKEDLLCAALPFIGGTPKVIVAGYGHLAFRDAVFEEEQAQLLVPSLANGYPHSLVHLYQCLANATRLGLSGVVAECSVFKGGTTMFLSRLIDRLGAGWPVIGFDTFGGFPPRRSPLDMYDHPDCVFTDLAAVRRYLDGRDIEIIAGDVADTCGRRWKGKTWWSASSTPTTTPPPGPPWTWCGSGPCRAGRSCSTTSPALTGSATPWASGSPAASCSMTPAISTCTAQACSTGSHFRPPPMRVPGETAARAPAADLRPVLVLRI